MSDDDFADFLATRGGGTRIEKALRDVRDRYAHKRILAQLEAMAADDGYMNAVGEEGRRRIHHNLRAARILVAADQED